MNQVEQHAHFNGKILVAVFFLGEQTLHFSLLNDK